MKKSILLVDDFVNTVLVTAMTIERAGYSVIKTNAALDALEILKSDTRVDLIITDYNMPIMNGLLFIYEIKKIPAHSNTPIFVLSTETNEEVKKSVLNAGVTLWIQKPFKADKFIEYIKRAIGS